MGGGKREKGRQSKTNNLVLKNMLIYETDLLKTKPTDTDAKQTITNANPTVVQ